MNTPVLIYFYPEGVGNPSRMDDELREVSAVLEDRVKVVGVEINRNKELSKALKINTLPAIIILNGFSFIWRGEGFRDSKKLLMRLDKSL